MSLTLLFVIVVCSQVLCWRTVPTDNSGIGEVARNSEPFMRQVFVVPAHEFKDEEELKRQVSFKFIPNLFLQNFNDGLVSVLINFSYINMNGSNYC